MFEQNAVRYLQWEQCTSRLAEVTGTKKVEELKPDASGYIRYRERTADTTTEASTLLQVQQCLVRRGVALDIAGVLSFEQHRLIADELRQHSS